MGAPLGPSAITTGLVECGFGPGGGGVVVVDICSAWPETGGWTTVVTVLPLESTYCTCCGVCVAAAWFLA